MNRLEPMIALQPILAVDIGGLIAIAFLIISFIGWLSNLVSAQQKPRAPQQRQAPRPRDRSIRDEIDQFLEQAAGNKERRPPPQPRAEKGVLSADDVELVEDRPRRAKRPKPSRPVPPRPAPVPTPAPQPAATPLSRQPVDNPIPVATATSAFAPTAPRSSSRGIEQSVVAHLGRGSASMLSGQNETLARPATKASALLALLRKPETMHQAVVLGEILGKPRSLRRP